MAETDNRSQSIARLLAWYAEMGASGAFGDAPVDWRGRASAPGAAFKLADGAGAASEPDPRNAMPVRASGSAPEPETKRAAPVSPSTGLKAPRGTGPPLRTFDQPSARANPRAGAAGPAARRVEAASLDELAKALAAFDGCGLKATAKNLCLYRGAEKARVMVIGEAPGRDEDIAGKPFVGAAGQLLDRMLAAIGLTESDVHITNIVYWRPPGNRTPTPIEALACQPFLDRQIALVGPSVLLLLGGVAAKHMLCTEEGIMKLRGRWRDVERGGLTLRALPSLHPAYLLRTPSAKRQAWRDLLALRAELDRG